ncbi:hypothetical protein CQW23_32670 [Capsicum baccatum]|uniref:Uncharacterized protein n=1 Tax=Capsicum baccatum TaxID=33114 RepID=A0A2G2V418_CAPBA|nr:hypothetical protein CQW23_32670 [Capsicum baccatum]
MDAQRDIERREAQQEQARLAVLAAAQVHQQNIDNPGRAINLDYENLGDDELLNPRRADEVASTMYRRDRQDRMRPDRRAMQVPFDDDDDNLDGAGSTAIIPPPLAPGAKFNITSTMIQLLQLKGLFGGLAGDDQNMHLVNFISTCKAFDNPGGRDESDSEEEANYLNNQGIFRGNEQGNQGQNYYDKSEYKDRDQGSWKNKTDRSGLYVSPGNREAVASGSRKMSMEDMMAKLLKGVEATKMGAIEVKNDLSLINQLVDSHSTAIKQLEQQLSQLSEVFNQRKVSSLPSDTVQNPRNDGSCMAITTMSGKVLDNPSKGKQVVDDTADNVIDAKCEDAVEAEESVHDVTPRRHQPEKSDK